MLTMNKNSENTTKFMISLEDIDLGLLQKCYPCVENGNTQPIWDINTLKKRNDDIYCEIEIYTNDIGRQNDTEEKRCEEISKNNREENMDLTTYVKIITNLHNDHKHQIKVVNEDCLEIVTLSGHTVEVSVDNFHGYFKIGEHIQCRVCRVMVEDVEVHKLTMKHMRLIMGTLQDQHCVRKIDNFWNHCILCNEIIENIEIHVLCCKTHIGALATALTDKPLSFKQPNIDKKQKITSNISTDTSDFPVPNVTNNVVTVYNKAVPVECKTCDIVLHPKIAYDHFVGKKHLKAFLKSQNQNKNEMICEGPKLPSNVCNDVKPVVKINKEDVMDALGNKTKNRDNHELNKNSAVGNKAESIETNANSHYCKVCNVGVPNNSYSIKEHNEGRKHAHNIKEFDKFNVKPSTRDKTDAKNQECLNLPIKRFNNDKNDDYDNSLKTQSETGAPVLWVASKNQESTSGGTKSTTFNTTATLTTSTNAKVEYRKKETEMLPQNNDITQKKDPSNAHRDAIRASWLQNLQKVDHHLIRMNRTHGKPGCIICNTIFEKGDFERYYKHLISFDHKNRYARFHNENGMGIVDETSIYCRYCAICIDRKLEFKHIVDDMRHALNLPLKLSAVQNSIYVLSPSNFDLYCRICCVNGIINSVNGVRMHMVSTKHCDNHSKLLTINHIIRRPGSISHIFDTYGSYYKCRPCKMEFESELDMYHHTQQCSHIECLQDFEFWTKFPTKTTFLLMLGFFVFYKLYR